MHRRTLLRATVAAATLGGLSSARAQAWPTRPIRIIQGFAPGGNADTIARLIGNELSRSLGQPVLVETRAGAGGNLASDAAAKAAPDGYTLVLLTGGHTASGGLYKSLPFDPVESFEMISTISQFPFIFMVRADSPHANLKALLDAARAKPDAIAYGSAGIGSTHHLTGELLARTAGVPMLHVPYKGDAASVTSLLGGDIPMMVGSPTVALPQIKGGKVRALAVSSNTRFGPLPDVPSAEEAGVPGFDVRSWTGLAATGGTPRPVIERLSAEVARALQLPEVRARIEGLGAEARACSPQELKERVAVEVARWKKVVADAKIPQQ
jgi:tripartite-type tricarboxylate transporter receptor subunit TctC